MDQQTPATPSRRPRFRRVSVQPVVLTPRDIEILRALYRYRFLRSTHLLALTRAPYKALMRRLQLLYHNGYIDRPKAQIDYYGTAGSQPMVYGLGNRGADAIADLDAVPRARVDWTAKNRDVGRVFIDHTVLTADILVALLVACRGREDVKFIDGNELRPMFPVETQRARNPFYFSVRVSHDGGVEDIGIIPDRVFALEFPLIGQRSYFFLESDRGTMPVIRSALDQTSVLRKMIGYYQAWRDGKPAARFGFRNFRVLFATTSGDRAESMRTANLAITEGQGSRIFLFGDAARITASGILSSEWTNGRGERTTLTE